MPCSCGIKKMVKRQNLLARVRWLPCRAALAISDAERGGGMRSKKRQTAERNANAVLKPAAARCNLVLKLALVLYTRYKLSRVRRESRVRLCCCRASRSLCVLYGYDDATALLVNTSSCIEIDYFTLQAAKPKTALSVAHASTD